LEGLHPRGLGDAIPVFSLEWYWTLPQDKWSERWRYAGRSIADTLAVFGANRRITATILAGTPGWWGRQVIIKWSDGELEAQTLLAVVEGQANHAMQHIDEIRQTLAPPPATRCERPSSTLMPARRPGAKGRVPGPPACRG